MNVRKQSVLLVLIMVFSTLLGFAETNETYLEKADEEQSAIESVEVPEWASQSWNCRDIVSDENLCAASYIEGESHNSYLNILVDSAKILGIGNLPDSANAEMVHMDAVMAFTGNRDVVDKWDDHRGTYNEIQQQFETSLSSIDAESLSVQEKVVIEMQIMSDNAFEDCSNFRNQEDTDLCELQIEELDWIIDFFETNLSEDNVSDMWVDSSIGIASAKRDSDFTVNYVSVAFASQWFWDNGELESVFGYTIDQEVSSRGGGGKLGLWKLIKVGFDTISYGLGHATDNDAMMDGAAHSFGSSGGGGGHVIGGDPNLNEEQVMCPQETWVSCSIGNILDPKTEGLDSLQEIWNEENFCPLDDTDSSLICVNSMMAAMYHNDMLVKFDASASEFGAGLVPYSIDRWDTFTGSDEQFVNNIISNLDLIALNTADEDFIDDYISERSDIIQSESHFWSNKNSSGYSFEDFQSSARYDIAQVESYCELNCTTLDWLNDLLRLIDTLSDSTTQSDFEQFFEDAFASTNFIQAESDHPHKQALFLMYSTYQASNVYWGLEDTSGRAPLWWIPMQDWIAGACGWAGNIMNGDNAHAGDCWEAGKKSRKSANLIGGGHSDTTFVDGQICELSTETRPPSTIARMQIRDELASCISERLTNVHPNLRNIENPWFEDFNCPSNYRLAACLSGINAGQVHNDMLEVIHESESKLDFYAFTDAVVEKNIMKLDLIVQNSGNEDYISYHKEHRSSLLSEFMEIDATYGSDVITTVGEGESSHVTDANSIDSEDLLHYIHSQDSEYPELDSVLSEVNSFIFNSNLYEAEMDTEFEELLHDVFNTDEYKLLEESEKFSELNDILNILHATYFASDSYWDDKEAGRIGGGLLSRLIDRGKLLINYCTSDNGYEDGCRWGQAVYSLWGSRSDGGTSSDNNDPWPPPVEGMDEFDSTFEELCDDSVYRECVQNQLETFKSAQVSICGEESSFTSISILTDQVTYTTGDVVEYTATADCLITGYNYDVVLEIIRAGGGVATVVLTFEHEVKVASTISETFKDKVTNLDASEYCFNIEMIDSNDKSYDDSTCIEVVAKKSAEETKSDDDGLPGFGFTLSLVSLVGAALIISRNKSSRDE